MAERRRGLRWLTYKEVKKAEPGDHSDGGGLILRVRDDGAAGWVFRFSFAGKRREMGLGAVYRDNDADASQSLTAARDAAEKARAKLQQGVDPIDDRKQLKSVDRQKEEADKAEKKRKAMTLARAARDYHERVIEPRLTAKHSLQWISSLENHVPAAIWNKPIAEIEAPELLAALGQVGALGSARAMVKGASVPETLRRIRQRLETVFEDAQFHGLCDKNPAMAIKRKMREQLPAKEDGAFLALDYRQAPALMARIRAAEGVSARALEFALLTASRTGEVLFATWSEFNLEEGVWVIPAARMKAGEPHTVHLSKRARELVAGQVGLDQQLVFPSTMKRGKPLSNMALLTTLDRLGVRGQTTVHGLCRAAFSTWANETGASRPDVIEACLAHKEADKVRASYNRASFDAERRALLEAWSLYLNTPRVVQLHAA